MTRYTLLYRPSHPLANERGFVDARDVEDLPPDPQHVPVFTDLYMDGLATVDGVDIGSHRKRRDYMKRYDYADANDFSTEWREANRRLRERAQEEHDLRAVRESWNRLVKP